MLSTKKNQKSNKIAKPQNEIQICVYTGQASLWVVYVSMYHPELSDPCCGLLMVSPQENLQPP